MIALLTCSSGSHSGHEHESPTRSNLTYSDDEPVTLRLFQVISIANVSWVLHLGLIADVIHATSQVLSKTSLVLAKTSSTFKVESLTESKLTLESFLPHEVSIVSKDTLVGPLSKSPATTHDMSDTILLWFSALLRCRLLHTANLVKAREDSTPVVAYNISDKWFTILP